MEFKQGTFDEIVESERQMVQIAAVRYPRFYPHALEAVLFMSTFLKSIDRDRFVFAMFLSQIKKHLMLALFSTVRLHRVQAMMDLRQVLEAGAAAAFAIAHPEHEHFVDTDERGILDPSKGLAKKRYDWLNKHYPDGSSAIKGMKDTINSLSAHANLVSAHRNFRLNDDDGLFEAPFFDEEDEHHVKTDLWFVGNVAINLTHLFFGVNQGRDVINSVDDFVSRLSRLEGNSKSLRDEMQASERYERTQELLQAAPPDSASLRRRLKKTWMPGTRPGMTESVERRKFAAVSLAGKSREKTHGQMRAMRQ